MEEKQSKPIVRGLDERYLVPKLELPIPQRDGSRI